MQTLNEVKEQLLAAPVSRLGTAELLGVSFRAEPSFFDNAVSGKLKFYLDEDMSEGFDTDDLSFEWYKGTCKNYAWKMLSEENGKQFSNAIKELVKDPLSRRAVAYYNAFEFDPSNRMCCTSGQFIICNGKLNYLVCYRSNDAFNAYPIDYAWHDLLHRKAVSLLPNVTKGDMLWYAGNLHLFQYDKERLL